jgi:hypothetical protein
MAPGGAQEGERGLLGAIGGGVAGHFGGKKSKFPSYHLNACS